MHTGDWDWLRQFVYGTCQHSFSCSQPRPDHTGSPDSLVQPEEHQIKATSGQSYETLRISKPDISAIVELWPGTIPDRRACQLNDPSTLRPVR
jgi:hypothetical protein